MDITFTMWILHYAKRSFEALFVHKYSQATLPIFSLKDNSGLKNCLYYWGFAVAQTLMVCKTSQISRSLNERLQNAGLGIFLVSEILNGYCHWALRRLRPKGSVGHFLPKGFLFNRITCPNYTFEILSWIGFAMVAQTVVSVLFPIVGGVQMWIWADEKRKKMALQWPEVAKRGRITPFRML
jgi:very-long-chain enoyl-CoA reductase